MAVTDISREAFAQRLGTDVMARIARTIAEAPEPSAADLDTLSRALAPAVDRLTAAAAVPRAAPAAA